ncbi:AF4/FMR2 family member 3-like [Carassius auratus]|uniref:AF4/FMR2 family member 3-like n=1 Tax=Carassius auratus TaxID=7957 RepID=A0A6P6PLP3_CARAU|nr:AF4/FMR2 family member 3-like [Carassius auratus]
MSDRQPTPHRGQCRPRMSGRSSVQMEDRNMLRRMEKERRSQEVQLEETQYDGIAPLFNKPYKRIKDDELSSRIQRMLGSYEDGYDGPEDPALSYNRSTPFPQAQSGHTDHSRAASGESWDCFLALSPPAEPLSPLQSSDSDTGPSPDRCRPDAPPLTLAPPLNMHSKMDKVKKPTAYVRPMDGQDQVTSGSPELKPSLQSYEHFQDLKENSKPNLAPLQANDMVSGVRVEDILQEMTSWPPLLTTICSPTTAEPTKVLSTNEETHGLPALAHESSDKVQLESRCGSSSSSDSDSSSDTDSEKSGSPHKPTAPETINTQPQKEIDWDLGWWLERKGHQQNPRSPCDPIRPNSHDSSERTEAPGSQTCHSDPADSGKVSDLRQTVGSTIMCEDPLLESTSTHRPKHKRKNTAHHTDQKRKPADNNNISRQTHPPLLVKIQLNLLSRIPREPKAAPPHTENSSVSRRKRAMERDEKSSGKKQKLDKERKRSSSSQQNLHQSEAVENSNKMMKKKKKSVKHSSGLPQDREQAAAPDGRKKKAETHGKKRGESHKDLLEKPPAAEARALLPDRRKLSVEDHLKEAKKLKHKADATTDKMAKALRYLEAALSFTESGLAMETEPQTPKSAYTMFSETLELIRFILKLKNYTDPAASAHERDFCVLCMRCQSLLQMAMFRSRREPALRHSRMLTDHFRSSSWSASPSVSRSGSLLIPQPVQQVAAAYVSITTLLLNAHHIWEQADQIALRGSGLLRELDSAVGPLSLTSSTSALVRYARHGLHWIRLDTQKPH